MYEGHRCQIRLGTLNAFRKQVRFCHSHEPAPASFRIILEDGTTPPPGQEGAPSEVLYACEECAPLALRNEGHAIFSIQDVVTVTRLGR